MTVHVRFRETFPLRVAEWFTSGAMATWGLITLANPGLFSESRVLIELSHILGQTTWGWLALVGGLVGWTALAINGALRRTPHVRVACAMVRCLIWIQITVALLASGQATTALAMYPWVLVLDIYNVFRAAADAGHSDKAAAPSGE